jgi:hypothetical protein
VASGVRIRDCRRGGDIEGGWGGGWDGRGGGVAEDTHDRGGALGRSPISVNVDDELRRGVTTKK